MKAAHALTRILVVVIGLLFSTAVHAQAIDDVWEMRESVRLDDLLSKWDSSAESCGAIVPNAKLGGFAKVLIYKIITPDSGKQIPGYYVVVLQSNNQDNGSDSGYAKINSLYCIKQSTLKVKLPS